MKEDTLLVIGVRALRYVREHATTAEYTHICNTVIYGINSRVWAAYIDLTYQIYCY